MRDFDAYMAASAAQCADLTRRIERLEKTPWPNVQAAPKPPPDAAAILNKLLVDQDIGEAVRERVFQLKGY